MTYDTVEEYPFAESSRDDGKLWCMLEGAYDDFQVCVPLRPFLAACFGVLESAITLDWSSYDWRYSATVRGAILTEAERQRLAEYED